MTEVLSYLPIVAAAAAILVALTTLVNGMFALRAKERLRVILRNHVDRDQELHRLMEEIAREHRHLSDRQIEEARAVLERWAEQLSISDQKLVIQGLRQASKSGEARFINDLMTAA